MQITIYVRHNHLENLYKFLGGDDDSDKIIEWYHDRPGLSRYYMVTIDYNDFVKLDDR